MILLTDSANVLYAFVQDARKQIEAKDYSKGMKTLSKILEDSDGKDRGKALDLLACWKSKKRV
jgi:hypothetical protein